MSLQQNMYVLSSVTGYIRQVWVGAALLLLWATSAVADCSSEYMSNAELADYLNTTAQLEPGLANVYSIGLTTENWDIPVLELSAADPTAEVPNVKFVGGVHGDEAAGTQLLISFIEHLVDGYRREERFITWLLNNTRIHILPRLNLDGYELAIEGMCGLGPGRFNSAGFDLNRVFMQTKEFVPEADAIQSWLASTMFVLSASVQAGEMVVVYPPDDGPLYGGPSKTTDEDVFRNLASVYANNHKELSKGGGCKDNNFRNGTVKGMDWYPVKGSMQDFNYKVGTMELTLEISCCKYPPSDQICNIWEENKFALMKLAAESCRGVRGRVTASGNVVAGASVSILGRNMTVRTNEQGYYFRILLPGRYFIKVESSGLKTFIKDFIVPKSETAFLQWAVLDVKLEAEKAPDDQNSGHSTTTEQPTNQTMSYDKGGLDPNTITTYDDSYLSSPNDTNVRVGMVSGSQYRLNSNIVCIFLACALYKYLASYS